MTKQAEIFILNEVCYVTYIAESRFYNSCKRRGLYNYSELRLKQLEVISEFIRGWDVFVAYQLAGKSLCSSLSF